MRPANEISASAAPIETDAIIVGAGPCGLFQVFELGLLGIKADVVDSLQHPGGQCTELYPDKPIYDIPALPVCGAQELIDRLLQQIKPFEPRFHLGQEVAELARRDDGRFFVRTALDTTFLARTVVIAAGLGSFQPKKLAVEGADLLENRQLHYRVRDAARFHGQRLVIFGGGDSALDWTLGLQDTAKPPIALVHRRDRFRALESSVNEAKALEDSGRVRIMTPCEVRELHGDGSIQAVSIENTKTGELHQVECDALITLLGFHSHLGSIADWGLDLHGKRQILVDPMSMDTSIPGVYAAGDVAGYDGKITLITIGFGEAAIAANNAIARIRGEKVQPKYSTD